MHGPHQNLTTIRRPVGERSASVVNTNDIVSFSGKDVEIDDNGNGYVLTTYPNQVSATS